MKTNPLVSVITATKCLVKKGQTEFLRQCVGSVQKQTYKNIEHIVVDGASSDGTVELLEQFKTSGMIKYISEQDSGMYSAMNKGVRVAKGKYVIILNADDYYHDTRAIELMVKSLEKAHADFSYAPVNVVNQDGTRLETLHYHENPILSDVFVHMPFSHQSMMVKRATLLEVGGFDERYQYAGDYDLVLKLCLSSKKSVFVPTAFLTYRIGGLSDQNSEKSTKEVHQILYEQFNKLLPVTSEECRGIFAQNISKIPYRVACELKKFFPYFDFERYIEQCSQELGELRREHKRRQNNVVKRGVRGAKNILNGWLKNAVDKVMQMPILQLRRMPKDIMETWHSEHLDVALSYLQTKSPNCLVIGCNRGEECSLLYKKGVRNINGIDLIHELGKNFRNKYTKYYSGQAENMHMFQDNSFDLVFSFATFEHIHDINNAYKEAVRVTKPGGIIYIYASPLWNSPYGHHYENIYKGYPWVHLRFASEQGLYAFCQKEGISTTPEQIHFMMKSDEFNRKSSREYFNACAGLQQVEIIKNQLAQIDEETKRMLDPELLKKGYSQDDLFSVWHLLVGRKTST